MTTFRRQVLNKAFKLFDLGILGLSYAIASVGIWRLTEFSSFATFVSMRVKVSNLLLILGLFYSWRVILSAFGLYRSRRLRDQKQEFADVLKAISAGTLVLGLVAAV